MIAELFPKDLSLAPPKLDVPTNLNFNVRIQMDGLDFLSTLEENSIPVAFFDPQYRGVLDKLGYGNEGVGRGNARCSLEQMRESTIQEFITSISQRLIPSGHLFLWMDKFHLCSGFTSWLEGTPLDVVDMMTWYKGRIGMGYRTRRTSEHLVILQKKPRRVKGVWRVRNIPDVWYEEVRRGGHTHKKPIRMQSELITAVSNPSDVVIDPAAGSFSVLEACQNSGRNFLGCDLNG